MCLYLQPACTSNAAGIPTKWGFVMRTSKFTGVLIGFAMLLTANAFAANKGLMQVQSPVMVGETQLPTGYYTVRWEGTGPDLELTIKRDRKVKATVAAKLVPENSAFDQNATIIRVESDGSRKLIAIRLSGKRFTLQIEPQTAVVGAGRNDPEAW
jgi:hypothetical protein